MGWHANNPPPGRLFRRKRLCVREAEEGEGGMSRLFWIVATIAVLVVAISFIVVQYRTEDSFIHPPKDNLRRAWQRPHDQPLGHTKNPSAIDEN